ncbi:hypothetical protein BO83DRAFT_61160 [Aspergillus eucalypticola CBS 122712]|uniref:Uncharacterized protein n=1 Tax=Aspergillus eucalypticola (strain CBS 122712 / IBT 29274) TaxID=1448314 RepID=A0A317VDF9_ASPEC|nr:uncharacterized protein BO83DRAFT_61160 [Aspergillus eucalypticola CBS 122712]PWY69920.1 hypothetical protein BO83DRAFT_61160 [Aspergillus eucalypticola CBS 122712]
MQLLELNWKGNYLVHNLGIHSSHVFASRSTSFLHSVLEATGGRGVNIVQNSLAGPLLHASWACVAPFGRMVESREAGLSPKRHAHSEAIYPKPCLSWCRPAPDNLENGVIYGKSVFRASDRH